MNSNIQDSFIKCMNAIQHKQFDELPLIPFDPPADFNWIRDVFEPMVVHPNADSNMLELLTDDNPLPITITYTQAMALCNQLLNWLRQKGLKQGDRIFIMCGLHEGLWITYLAAIKGGFVLIPAASILNADDIAYRFEKASPQAIVTDSENRIKMEQALVQYNKPVSVQLLLDDVQDGWTSSHAMESASKQAVAADTLSNEDLFWFFTSGTTGLPKVVVHTHASYPLGHLTTAAWIGLKPGDKHYNISQPGWAKFAWSSVFAALNTGATIFVYRSRGRFDAARQLQVIQDYKVTTLCAPPTALRLLIQENLPAYRFSLRQCVSAGEPLNAEVIKIWKEGTGMLLRDGYGQTESTCMIYNLPGSKIKFGSMGKPAFMYDIIIADSIGEELPVHETGQVSVRMRTGRFNGIFKMYIGDAERQKDVFKHGLCYTGDKAYKDEDGYFWFVGRDDDVIKSSDYRIGPFEIESILLEIDEILESAVVGSPHVIKGQEIKAFIVLVKGITVTSELADKVFAYCKSRLAPYKMPRIIEFVPDLPKTISGKIRRIELRAAEEQHKAEKELRAAEFFLK